MDAAETRAPGDCALPDDLVFVDLETTGGNASYHRITEVGIVRMTNGAIVEQWNSLVDPQCRIPAYIEAFTGITNDMVAGAPRFAEIAPLVLEKLRGPVFVAHNARFDYAFLRSEFRRLDMQFTAKVLCTVKLSRRLFPQHRRHSLDAVMERHGLTCTARHRALGDARVLGEFWSALRREVPEEQLAAAAQAVIGANRTPAHLPPGLCDELPEGPGVYRFFGEDNVLLYVGKSRSLRERVLRHFAAEHTEASEQKKVRMTRRVDWVETASDLGAQLMEAQWIKSQRPLFNKRQKAAADCCTLQAGPGPGVRLAAIGELDPPQREECFGVFHSRKHAQKALVEIARAHALCLKVLELEDGAGSCFAYQLGKCRGACIGKETLALHRARLLMALSALKLKPWPFPGRIALKEARSEFHVLDRWAYLGTARSTEELDELRSALVQPAFDADVYRILLRHLRQHPDTPWVDLRTGTAPAVIH